MLVVEHSEQQHPTSSFPHMADACFRLLTLVVFPLAGAVGRCTREDDYRGQPHRCRPAVSHRRGLSVIGAT